MKKIFLILILLFSMISMSNEEDDISKILSELSEVGKENVEITTREQIVEFAKTNLDTPYKWGAVGPNNFDCSGFVKYVFENNSDINLPRVSRDMSKYSTKKTIEELKVGDLLFFITSGKSINHVGIYIGDGDFIHASSAKKKVVISTIKDGFYKKAFRWAINPFYNNYKTSN